MFSTSYNFIQFESCTLESTINQLTPELINASIIVDSSTPTTVKLRLTCDYS